MEPNFQEAVAITGDVKVISTAFEKELLYTERLQSATSIEPDQSTISISTSGSPGFRGDSGSSGSDYSGGDGGRGGDGGHGRNAERNIVGVFSDGENLSISRVLPPIPNDPNRHTSCKFELMTFPLNNYMRCALYALGGPGGDGGDGGRGGSGYSGSRGQDATQFSDGTDGGIVFALFNCTLN